MTVIVGLADSGVAPELAGSVVAAQRFRLVDGVLCTSHVVADTLGHGAELSRIIHSYLPDVKFVLAQVLDERGVSTAAAMAAGIEWLAPQCSVINLSVGLRANREVMAEACLAAARQQCLLVASTPALGAPVYPAAYEEVIAVTGDINCPPEFFSHPQRVLGRYQLAGCCYRLEQDQKAGKGGASYAAAHASGWLAKALAEGCDASAIERFFPAPGTRQPVNLIEKVVESSQ